jgi:hypothetical protein
MRDNGGELRIVFAGIQQRLDAAGGAAQVHGT